MKKLHWTPRRALIDLLLGWVTLLVAIPISGFIYAIIVTSGLSKTTTIGLVTVGMVIFLVTIHLRLRWIRMLSNIRIRGFIGSKSSLSPEMLSDLLPFSLLLSTCFGVSSIILMLRGAVVTLLSPAFGSLMGTFIASLLILSLEVALLVSLMRKNSIDHDYYLPRWIVRKVLKALLKLSPEVREIPQWKRKDIIQETEDALEVVLIILSAIMSLAFIVVLALALASTYNVSLVQIILDLTDLAVLGPSILMLSVSLILASWMGEPIFMWFRGLVKWLAESRERIMKITDTLLVERSLKSQLRLRLALAREAGTALAVVGVLIIILPLLFLVALLLNETRKSIINI